MFRYCVVRPTFGWAVWIAGHALVRVAFCCGTGGFLPACGFRLTLRAATATARYYGLPSRDVGLRALHRSVRLLPRHFRRTLVTYPTGSHRLVYSGTTTRHAHGAFLPYCTAFIPVVRQFYYSRLVCSTVPWFLPFRSVDTLSTTSFPLGTKLFCSCAVPGVGGVRRCCRTLPGAMLLLPHAMQFTFVELALDYLFPHPHTPHLWARFPALHSSYAHFHPLFPTPFYLNTTPRGLHAALL